MKRRYKIPSYPQVYLFLALTFLCPSGVKANDSLYEIIVPETFRIESNFTETPATMGALAFTIPAFVVGGTVYAFGYGIGFPFGMENEIAGFSGGILGLGIIRLGSTATGAPFYFLEKTFHDIPLALINLGKTETSPDKAQMKKPDSPGKRQEDISFAPNPTETITRIKAVPNTTRCEDVQGRSEGRIPMGRSAQMSSGYIDHSTCFQSKK